MSNMSEKKIDFKKNVDRLEEIVNTISSQTLSLEESLKLYEEGKEIIKLLSQELKEAEEKVENIVDIKSNSILLVVN